MDPAKSSQIFKGARCIEIMTKLCTLEVGGVTHTAHVIL